MSFLYQLVVILSAIVNFFSRTKWQEKAEHKKTRVRSLIPKEWILNPEFFPRDKDACVVDIPEKCGILSRKELDITENCNAKDLAAKISTGSLTALEVTTAFAKEQQLQLN
ncbi:unnamed protein product [Kuraishia capsulata CBS 1993]|uniref:Uncharacterized protein n=1 Tax=Kuraishia capsulata CBS 1993 TaxID=1382522 RepID=W6MHL5_9ASCO|nr:uncharacterized protein KUCA_T00001195001 [Kuraishia capsulata CBS 1993]CDK25228.1 unnamed protein product [Kuraishia capsulata CBS 1993]